MQAIVDSGLIEVDIRTQRMDKGEDGLCITVIDNGEGICEEDMERVFKPFWTSRASQGGSGIGLTMVQRIVKINHGRIDISSPQGEQKTTVRISIPPYAIDEKSKPAPLAHSDREKTVATKAAKTQETTPQNILLVDDMHDILVIHQAVLSRIGHTSETADSVDSALAMFKHAASHFDLIITDYRMPEKDGLMLIKEIRAIDSSIPILMVTAFGEDEQLQCVGEYNASLINKPVTMNKMKEAIAAASTAANQLA